MYEGMPTRSNAMKNSVKIIAVALLGLGILGCNEVNPPIQARSDPYGSRQILFTDPALANETAAQTTIPSRDTYGYLHINVPIRSAIDRDLRVDYSVQYFDSVGQVIETTTWQTRRCRSAASAPAPRR
jgi:hypothetical protein